jgi:tartrate-resistant acid phosphatase type 5
MKPLARAACAGRIFFLLIGLLLLAACQARFSTPVPAISPSASELQANPEAGAPDRTAEVPPTATLSPSPTATASQTATPTHTQPPPTASLTPSATPEPPLRFAVIGDYGSGLQPEADVAALVKGWTPEFILTVGDNNYDLGQAETIDAHIGQFYHEFIYPYHGIYGPGSEVNRFFPVLGNHDWLTASAQPYFDYFTLPGNERYYDFTWGPLHLFALDSDSNEPDGVGVSSRQAAWLKEALAASTAPWQIVYMHHPPFASGPHGGIDWMNWPFTEWGADVALAGHDHIYERIQVDGFTYLINGLGGGAIYAIHEPVPGSQLRYNGDYGAILAEATPSDLTFRFVTRLGELIDTFTLNQ